MTDGQSALLKRLHRSPLPVVYGRAGWRPAVSLPKPATKADFDALIVAKLARVIGGNLVAVEQS